MVCSHQPVDLRQMGLCFHIVFGSRTIFGKNIKSVEKSHFCLTWLESQNKMIAETAIFTCCGAKIPCGLVETVVGSIQSVENWGNFGTIAPIWISGIIVDVVGFEVQSIIVHE